MQAWISKKWCVARLHSGLDVGGGGGSGLGLLLVAPRSRRVPRMLVLQQLLLALGLHMGPEAVTLWP